MEKINIVETIQNTLCTESTDGQKVYALISGVLSERKTVHVSFLNVKIVTVGFLNAAIGQLYQNYSKEDIKSCVLIEHLSLSGAVILKHVVDRVKFDLQNKESEDLRQRVNYVLEEE